MKQKLKGWKDIAEGGTIEEPGSSVGFDVQAWRTFRPVVDRTRCTKCGMCWIFCPEGAIKYNADGSYEVDSNFCKGCGICSRACAVKAITMKKEGR